MDRRMDYHLGGSPGAGVTPARMSREPLATEGEATIGPDDWNPYDEVEREDELRAAKRSVERQTDTPDLSLGLEQISPTLPEL